MPLLDHFEKPLREAVPWRSFHGTWAVAIAWSLNAGVLPRGFRAVPFLDRDGPIEIDVATLQPSEAQESRDEELQWSPEAPGLAVAVDWPETGDVGVEIHSDEGESRLAAAVELVSPRNKDRPDARRAFANKCAEYLRHGTGLVVVDVVMERRANLHAELLAALGVVSTSVSGGSLSVVAYRAVSQDGEGGLHGWPVALRVGEVLPTVPLWLGGEVAVPLDLEASYAAVCANLRIAGQVAGSNWSPASRGVPEGSPG